jgi:hypothetical protein
MLLRASHPGGLAFLRLAFLHLACPDLAIYPKPNL